MVGRAPRYCGRCAASRLNRVKSRRAMTSLMLADGTRRVTARRRRRDNIASPPARHTPPSRGTRSGNVMHSLLLAKLILRKMQTVTSTMAQGVLKTTDKCVPNLVTRSHRPPPIDMLVNCHRLNHHQPLLK
ncbi:hypothetical protein EVAR_88483_1 [Eumeta japonica]|uniref:Uncharacterized protein n=1 Tax=Eumeta variegata TaxID=151549 RepID=A0A4C1XTJ9_EUMVA|nr:hypothetical protein EVAR_88483_1 [Eumeta japonica]